MYLVGIGIATLLLMTEHKIIKPSNRKLMKVASYNLNQVISIVILLCTLIDFSMLVRELAEHWRIALN